MNKLERFYDFDEIRARINCLEYATGQLGMSPRKPPNGFDIPWRAGSDSGALIINEKSWTDFVKGKGEKDRSGSVIDLVALVKHGGDRQLAQQELGEYLGLEPAQLIVPEKKSRLEFLKQEGWQVVKSYDYQDEAGKVRHKVYRLQHPKKKGEKEFVQETANGGKVKGTKTYLYRLPEWKDKKYICLCEGEKDCNAIWHCGIPATTNPSGGGAWEPHYNEWFKDKHVVIIEDNDDAGQQRTAFLLWELKDIAASLKVMRFPEFAKGFDTFDFLSKFGKDKFIERGKGLTVIDKKSIKHPNEDYRAIQTAKEANKSDFKNFYLVKDEKGEETRRPRQINDLINELHKRFLGFPRKVGNEQLFDHDRDSGRIEWIYKPATLFAWIARKSGRKVHWGRIEGCVSKDELYEAAISDAKRYEAISHVLNWPKRNDVYYAHKPMPRPTSDKKYFNELVNMFEPANEVYRRFLQAFLAAPLYYRIGIARPSWVIDSQDGAGTGKTTLAEIAANLYSPGGIGSPIKTDQEELQRKPQELIKRIVSHDGRQARILLVDNVEGNFSSSTFADLVTAQSISGRAPYGRGEETRPNNLTYVITSNSANLDNDISCRSFFIHLKKPVMTNNVLEDHDTWKQQIIDYICKYQLHIIADIVSILEQGAQFKCKPSTRFPEFERYILKPQCANLDEYSECIKTLFNHAAESNVEEELAREIEEIIQIELTNSGFKPHDECYFIRSKIVEKWMRKGLTYYKGNILQQIRNLAKMKLLTAVDPSVTRYPRLPANQRRSGIMWNYSKDSAVQIIGYQNNGKIGVILSR